MTCRASTHGRRRATGVTIVPIRTRDVTTATAPSTVHGSQIGGGASRSTTMWSQKNTPSQPFASAVRAMSTSHPGSAMFGTERP